MSEILLFKHGDFSQAKSQAPCPIQAVQNDRVMKNSLEHLPANKQRDLDRIVQMLFEDFEDAVGEPTGSRKLGRVLKIILFGSYATGRWVDEPHTKRGYQSDYVSDEMRN